MEYTIREVEPGELADAVEPGELTLVLGAPAIGKSHYVRALGPSVSRLGDIAAHGDDELVVVDDFAAAVFDLDDEFWSTYEYGEKSLSDRPGGVVLVTRPRSLDWLCQHHGSVSAALIETADTVLVVRTPPPKSSAAIDEIRATIATQRPSPLREDDLVRVRDRCTTPAYEYENPTLRSQLGWYDTTVTPAAFLSLSKYDDRAVLAASDVQRELVDNDVSVGPLLEELLEYASTLVPRDGLASRIPSDDSPAVRTAVALVAVALETDAEWLAPFVRYRPLAPAAETLEIALDVPPGTVDLLRLFAAETPRGLLRDRLTEADSAFPTAVDLDAIGTTMATVGEMLESVAWTPDEYGSFPLVGAWHWEGPAELTAAAAGREFPDAGENKTNDGVSGVCVDDVLEALDGGLVVLSGPNASGKRRLAASVATALTGWGATVKLPDLRQPDHSRAGIHATPDVVVFATYGADPARIVSDAGVRALVDWVDEGVCTGAVLLCDDGRRDQLDTIAERAGCPDVATWRDRTELGLQTEETSGRTSRAVADALLSAMNWPETTTPSRQTLDVEPVTDQSTLAAIAGIPDSDLDTAFVGRVVADAVDVVGQTAQPTATTQWLALVDDLVAGVAYNRGDPDSAITYRGAVYGTAMAAIATENPTTDEWVEAIAGCAIDLTNETAAPHEVDAVGGDREPAVGAFAAALATLAWPGDGTGPNHSALACVDQVLHRTIDAGVITEARGVTLLCRIYGEMCGRIIDTVDDPTVADEALAPVAALIQQAAATNGDDFAAFVIGNSFGAALGAVAGAACPPDELPTWVDALGSRVRESVAFVQRQDARTDLLQYAYTNALGFWAFEFDCPRDRIEPWLSALGDDLCRTVTTADLDDPQAFVVDVYGQAVQRVVGYRDLDRAELLFGVCERFVDTVAASGLADEEWEYRGTLHATALAAFARVEQDHPDSVKNGPYGTGLFPSPESPRFGEWIDLYDAAVMRGAAAETAPRERERYLAAVYRGALSIQVSGFDDEMLSETAPHRGSESGSGISPRQETTWYQHLTDRIETVAGTVELVDDPVAFLRGVFGDAAVNWVADGNATLSQKWLSSLVSSLRACRLEVDGPTKTEWFDAFAGADGAILRTVLTRTEMGQLTHERLVQTVLDQIETAATAADNPVHPVDYVGTVFGTALALAVEADLEEVRFGVTEVLAAAEDAGFDWVGVERAAILEQIFARALAVVGHSHSDHPNTEEWLDVFTEQLDATATSCAPDDPAAFVAGVYTRASVHAVDDGVDAWRRRLDTELRAFAAGPHVEDPAAFLEGVYADIVVTGTTNGQPSAAVEACVRAVHQSAESASEDGHFLSDDALVRTFSRAADSLRAKNVHARADHLFLFGQALRAVGGEVLETAVFDASDPTDD
ncbi:hypothetical protein [Haloarchaeobius sp. DYHT-AS-18]|uniref:hypothetical protein n=1 Tax=Haloarchaeobius sp. DYHT-AS-18 TaxID=3446117 RepID=UPI003EBC286A